MMSQRAEDCSWYWFFLKICFFFFSFSSSSRPLPQQSCPLPTRPSPALTPAACLSSTAASVTPSSSWMGSCISTWSSAPSATKPRWAAGHGCHRLVAASLWPPCIFNPWSVYVQWPLKRGWSRSGIDMKSARYQSRLICVMMSNFWNEKQLLHCTKRWLWFTLHAAGGDTTVASSIVHWYRPIWLSDDSRLKYQHHIGTEKIASSQSYLKPSKLQFSTFCSRRLPPIPLPSECAHDTQTDALTPPAYQEPPDGEEVCAMSLQLPAYL